MKPGKKQIKRMSAAMLTALLFTVFMQSAYACLLPASGAALAFDSAQSSGNAPQGDCHARVNPNQCLSECTAFDQNNGQLDLTPAVPSASVAVLVLPAHEIAQPLLALNDSAPARVAAPPPSILFCSLLL